MCAARPFQDAFDQVAELYDEMRPGYSPQLVEDVFALANLPDGGRILEIGCGTGKATVPFAQRGYPMLCIEPGARLAEMTRSKCADYPNVTVSVTTYEDWPLQANAFDLVICAEAFHWISPAVQWPKTVAALKPGGTAAIFWTGGHTVPAAFHAASEALFRAAAPQFWAGRNKSRTELEQETLAVFATVEALGDVTLKRYAWREQYSADAYVKLLQTYAPIQQLAANVRDALLTRIHELVVQHGGMLDCEYVSRLYVARVNQ